MYTDVLIQTTPPRSIVVYVGTLGVVAAVSGSSSSKDLLV